MKQALTMTSVAHYLGKVALLAIAYYVSGRLGLLLAVPPGYATAMWPPSGFALAGILLLGYRYWPGVLLGSFAVNLFTSFDPSNTSSMLTSGCIAAIIAGGATLQAIVSAWLCRRWIVFPNAFEQTRDIGLLLALGGAVGCLVNSLIGVGTLTVFGLIPVEKSPFNWLTWWVGDTIGVLVFTPIVLLIGNRAAQVSSRRKKVASMALVGTFAVTIAMFIAARDWEHERQRFSFERKASFMALELEEHIMNYRDDIYAVALLYKSSQDVTHREFETFAAGTMERHPGGIKGLTWAPKVADGEREQFEAAMRREGFADFRITEQDGQGRSVPAARRDVYYPVTYIEPYVAKLHGFDNNSEEIRRATLEKARDQADRQATPRLNIIQKGKDNYGMLIFRPVYRNGTPGKTVEERRQNIKGFIVGAFILSDLIDASLKNIADKDVDFYITDDDSPPEEQLLYDSRTADHKESRTVLPSHPRDMHWQRQINVAGRSWTLHCMQGQAALLAHQNWTVWLVLAGGLLFTSLFGVFVMMITARTDIVRRLVEQRTRQLRESEETFRLAMEHASIGMALVGPDGRWLKVNNALCSLVGYSEPELMRTDFQAITHREDLQADLEYVRQMLASEIQTYQMEKRYLHKNGHTIWVLLSVSLVHNADGSPKYFVSQIQDITQRKEMDRMKSEFISTVSHELRTPLTSIRGSLGLIEAGVLGKLPEKAESMVKIAHQNSERLVRIINDILDIEKIESGKLQLHIANVPVAPFLQQALDVNQGYGEKYQVRFVLEAVPATAAVLADPDRLMQVMANLLSNAAKFSPQGGLVRVRAQVSGASVRFEVEDRGTGIPEEFRGRIFQKFAQADASASRRFDGTGLGLSITKQLVEAMNGTIAFSSIVGQGTTFFFELPWAEAAMAAAAQSASASSQDGAACRVLICGDEASISGERMGLPRILHVEDDRDLANVIDAALSGRAQVVTAQSLQAAQDLLKEQTFSLVVLDLALPDGSGLELLERLQGSAGRPPPVVILSASEAPPEARQRVAAALVKSRTSEARIVETVLSLLRRTSGRKGPV